MAQHSFRSTRRDMAMEMSIRLSEAADRLEYADNPEAFVAAIEANRAVWLRLKQLARHVGCTIPDRLMRASLSATSGRRGLDDHKVELLISIDRQISATMAESAAI